MFIDRLTESNGVPHSNNNNNSNSSDELWERSDSCKGVYFIAAIIIIGLTFALCT